MKHNKKSVSMNDGFSATSEFQTGGFIFNLQPIIETITKGDFLQSYNLLQGRDIDFSFQLPNGDTILHILLKNFDKYRSDEKFYRLLNFVLSKSTPKTLNIQNNDGDTPLHIAVKNNLHEIASSLISRGSNPKIPNKDDLLVSSIKEKELKTLSVSFSDPNLSVSAVGEQLKPIMTKLQPTITKVESGINKFVESAQKYASSLLSPKTNVESVSEPISMLSPSIEPIKPFETQMNIESIVENPKQAGGKNVDLFDSEQFISELMKQYNGKNYKNDNSNNIKKDDGSNNIKKGGHSVIGQRKLNRLDMSGGKKKVESDTESDKSISEIGRLIKTQSDIIHERVVNMIKDIMNVDEQTAKYYKAGLWKMVKEKFPTLSNLDKSLELEKMTTKENLDTIPIEQLSEEIKQHFKEKEEKRKERYEKRRERKHSRHNESSESSVSSESSESSEEKPKRRSKKETSDEEKPKRKSKKVKSEVSGGKYSTTSPDSIPFGDNDDSTSEDD